MSTAVPVTLPEPVWVPCPMCWGQRRIFVDRNGEGYVPCTCPECLGVGERATFPAG